MPTSRYLTIIMNINDYDTTIEQAARLLKCSVRTIHNMKEAGMLKQNIHWVKTPGKRIWFSARELLGYLEGMN